MYFPGVSSLPLIGQSGASRFCARLLSAVSTMIELANALRTSSQSLAVDFMDESGDSMLHDLARELLVVVHDIIPGGGARLGVGSHQRHWQTERHRPAHDHRVANLRGGNLRRGGGAPRRLELVEAKLEPHLRHLDVDARLDGVEDESLHLCGHAHGGRAETDRQSTRR